MHPCNGFVLLEHYLRVFRSIIFVTIVFLSRSSHILMAQLTLIGFSLSFLLITAINFRKYVSKLYWAVNAVKILLLAAFQVCFLLLYKEGSADVTEEVDKGA